MVNFRCDLTDKADKVLERYKFYNDCISKQEACIEILEHYNINEDFQDWLKKEKEAEE